MHLVACIVLSIVAGGFLTVFRNSNLFVAAISLPVTTCAIFCWIDWVFRLHSGNNRAIAAAILLGIASVFIGLVVFIWCIGVLDSFRFKDFPLVRKLMLNVPDTWIDNDELKRLEECLKETLASQDYKEVLSNVGVAYLLARKRNSYMVLDRRVELLERVIDSSKEIFDNDNCSNCKQH